MTARKPGFRRAEDGGVAIYSALAVSVIVGVGALSLDLGRYMNLHTELQHAADAAALAGAAELNGQSAAGGTLGARARAEAAARSALFANRQSFATDGAGSTVLVKSVEFFSELNPKGTDKAAKGDDDAHYIRVTVVDRTLESTLIAPVLGAGKPLTTSASAVAGMTEAVCNFPPLMICNPNGSGPFTVQPGQMIRLNTQAAGGGGPSWENGMFSLLELPYGNSTPKKLAENMATNRPNGCYGASIKPRTGEVASAHDGVNVRFDMYDGFVKSYVSDVDYAPAKNVTKGRVDNKSKCDFGKDTGTALPLDNCFLTSPNTCANGRFGDGNWNRSGYWSANHPGVSFPSGLAGASRYSFYRYEIDNGIIPDNSKGTPPGEDGNPRCYKKPSAISDDPDRRVMNVAIADCTSGDTHELKVIAFGKMFIVRPMLDYADDPAHSDGNLYVELIGKLEYGVDKPLHQLIQLYR